MRDKDSIIAKETLFGQEPGRDRFPITIEIGSPFPWGDTSPTEWACWIRVAPFIDKPRDIHGEGALQPLCLALQYIHWELSRFLDDGGVIFYETGEKFSLSNLWPSRPY